MTKKQQRFSDRVHAVVKKIPKGKTMTYKQVATKAGNPKAARAVGMIMSHNFNSKIPCHRVVRGDGKKAATIAAAGSVNRASHARRRHRRGRA
jgi:O-6-methylguanine DNA methyltransferase